MRAGPIGLLFQELSEVTRAARQQSRITHLDPRCAAGAAVVAGAVWHAAKRQPLEIPSLLDELAGWAEEEERSVGAAVRGLAEWISLPPAAAAKHVHESGLDRAHPRWQGISAFVTPSVLWSLYAFLRTPDDYWETVCTAIWVGGDTDTMAAIAGAISGARLGTAGLPADLLPFLTDRGTWGARELTGLAHCCADLLEER